MIELKMVSPEDWLLWRQLRLEALREAPHAYGSTLADWQGEGDTEQRWRNRLISVDLNVIAQVDGMPAGMASGHRKQDDVELASMWVAPFARGTGVGDRLVGSVVDWAQRMEARRVLLSVKANNLSAVRLYSRHAFMDAGPSPESEPGATPERLMIRSLRDSFD